MKHNVPCHCSTVAWVLPVHMGTSLSPTALPSSLTDTEVSSSVSEPILRRHWRALCGLKNSWNCLQKCICMCGEDFLGRIFIGFVGFPKRFQHLKSFRFGTREFNLWIHQQKSLSSCESKVLANLMVVSDCETGYLKLKQWGKICDVLTGIRLCSCPQAEGQGCKSACVVIVSCLTLSKTVPLPDLQWPCA